MKQFIALSLLIVVCTSSKAQTDDSKIFFREQTSSQPSDSSYGKLLVTTKKGETKVIQYVMAYGENISALTVQLNNGFSYKLAPAPAGSSLNYVGSSLHIVLKDGDTAKIDFNILNNKREASRYIYLSGYSEKEADTNVTVKK